MNGTSPARLALALGAIAGASCAVRPPQPVLPPRLDKPNIVLILTDELDPALLGYMPLLRTELSSRGVTFSNSFVTGASSSQARVSMLTGRYAHGHRVLGDRPPLGSFRRWHEDGGESSTVATWLREAGYTTAHVGSYLSFYPRSRDPHYVPPGWSRWFGLFFPESYYDFRANLDGQTVERGDAAEDYQSDVLLSRALGFLDSSPPQEPFFLSVSFHAPHNPAVPADRHARLFPEVAAPRRPPREGKGDGAAEGDETPDHGETPVESERTVEGRTTDQDESTVEGERTDEDRSGRDDGAPPRDDVEPEGPATDTEREAPGTEPLDERAIREADEQFRDRIRAMQAVDEAIAGIVARLRETGRLERTYLLFSSVGAYREGGHHGRGAAYDESIRVPLIVRGPWIPWKRRIEHFALNIDLAPTIAELAGVEIPDFVDGRSLMPAIDDSSLPAEEWRSDFLIERWSKGEGGEVPDYTAVRSGTHLYVERAGGERELYDLAADPGQLRNLVETAAADLLLRLAGRLAMLAACIGESCRLPPVDPAAAEQEAQPAPAGVEQPPADAAPGIGSGAAQASKPGG